MTEEIVMFLIAVAFVSVGGIIYGLRAVFTFKPNKAPGVTVNMRNGNAIGHIGSKGALDVREGDDG